MSAVTGHGERSQYVFFTLPAIVLFVVFVLYPVFGGVGYSLTDWNGVASAFRFIGIQNYRTLAADPAVLIPFRNTFVFAFLQTILQNILSLLMALAVDRKLRTKNLLRTLMFVPAVLAPLVVGYVWAFLFTEPIASLGKTLGIGILGNNALGSPKSALLSGVFVGSWRMAGYTMVIYIAALQGVPRELLDAAHVDGARAWRRFWSVTFPLIAPAVTINLVLTMERGFKEFDMIFALTQGGPGNSSEVISLTIYNESFQYFRAAYGTTIGVMLFVVIVVLSYLEIVVLRKNEDRAL